MSKNVREIVSIGVLFYALATLFASMNSFAEGAGDYFLYDVSKLPKDIMIDSIGMIIFSIEEIEKGMQQYERDENVFIAKTIIPINETHPVGEGGYGGWYKYLVVDVSGNFVKIIINPYRNSRAWVQQNNKTASGHNLIVFDELIGKDLKLENVGEIDVFILSKETKLYKEPKESSNYVVIKKEFQERRIFYPIAFRKDFVQIGEEFFDEDTIETTFGKPIGWIKTRNDDGAIAFYLYTFSWL